MSGLFHRQNYRLKMLSFFTYFYGDKYTSIQLMYIYDNTCQYIPSLPRSYHAHALYFCGLESKQNPADWANYVFKSVPKYYIFCKLICNFSMHENNMRVWQYVMHSSIENFPYRKSSPTRLTLTVRYLCKTITHLCELSRPTLLKLILPWLVNFSNYSSVRQSLD